MPRPPILPVIDWPTVYTFAPGFEDWLEKAESKTQRDAINAALAAQVLEPQEEATVQNLVRTVRVLEQVRQAREAQEKS